MLLVAVLMAGCQSKQPATPANTPTPLVSSCLSGFRMDDLELMVKRCDEAIEQTPDQAEDRCHRLGMGDGLTCHWLQLGAADQLVDGLLASKAERIEVLLGPRRLSLQRQSLPAMVRDCLQLL